MTNRVDSAIETLAKRLAEVLVHRGARIATAESCTGGLIAGALTRIPGSSGWFEYGFVTYGNNAKSDLLGVPEQLIDAHGAVSEPVAIRMAEGALDRASSEFAVAVTGIAGPDGGTDEKPVGTVWFAWAQTGAETVATVRCFDGDRDAVRNQSVEFALAGLVDRTKRR